MPTTRAEQAARARQLVAAAEDSGKGSKGGKASSTPPEIADREPVGLKVGDLVVDEETGEILELPKNVGEPVAWMTHKLVEATAARKAWEQHEAIYKAVLGKLLDDANLTRMRTEYGTAGRRSRLNRRVRIERLPVIKEVFELSDKQINLILTCAKELDVNALEALPSDAVPTEVIKLLIDESASSWVQISPLSPMPPPVEQKEPCRHDRHRTKEDERTRSRAKVQGARE